MRHSIRHSKHVVALERIHSYLCQRPEFFVKKYPYLMKLIEYRVPQCPIVGPSFFSEASERVSKCLYCLFTLLS